MNNNIETVGNVNLDLTYYPGEDFYSEGASEDALLDIVKQYRTNEYAHIIQDTRSWSVMYHLSHIRENIVSWLPITEKDSVLEIGAGCGAITGKLCEMAGKVTCIELSKKRSLINANRNKGCDNLNILVGNFKDIEVTLTEKYDYITLIGVFEYALGYIGGEDPYYQMIETIKKHLKPDGKIIIAIENKYGLKYFAGCKEDHTGNYYEGIEGYREEKGVKTFSNEALCEFFERAGMKHKLYYPYPDYKLPHTIYSDEYLPKKGELTTNLRNFDTDRIVTFDETKVFDSLIEEGQFPWFSNSYLAVVTFDDIFNITSEFPVFSKYANERSETFRVDTVISQNKEGERFVYKIALDKKSNNHIEEIYDNYNRLKEIYSDTKFSPNNCEYFKGLNKGEEYIGIVSKVKDRIKLEYIKGITLESYLDRLEELEQYEKMIGLLKEYAELINMTSGQGKFVRTAAFEAVFGKHDFAEEYASSPMVNYDMIFSNIVFDREKLENGPWTVIDYEWMFKFPIPVKFIIYRGLFYYLNGRETKGFYKYLAENKRDIYLEFGISDKERQMFEQMEQSFQLYIIDGMASLEVMQAIMPSNAIRLDHIIDLGVYLKNLNLPMVYYSSDGIFTSDKHINVLADVTSDRTVSFDIKLSTTMRSVRIDPTEYPCLINIKKAELHMYNGKIVPMDKYLVNGFVISKNTVVYDTNDAQIVFENIPEGGKVLRIEYNVTMIEQEYYSDLVKYLIKEKEKNTKEETFLDKLQYKLKLKERVVLPEGFVYNTEGN